MPSTCRGRLVKHRRRPCCLRANKRAESTEHIALSFCINCVFARLAAATVQYSCRIVIHSGLKASAVLATWQIGLVRALQQRFFLTYGRFRAALEVTGLLRNESLHLLLSPHLQLLHVLAQRHRRLGRVTVSRTAGHPRADVEQDVRQIRVVTKVVMKRYHQC